MIMLVMTVIINWFVIFALTIIFTRNMPEAIMISGAIIAVFIALSVSPAGEYLVRLQFGCREATRDEADIFGPALNQVWERASDAQPTRHGFYHSQKSPRYTWQIANTPTPTPSAPARSS